jgi:hypothetical protein
MKWTVQLECNNCGAITQSVVFDDTKGRVKRHPFTLKTCCCGEHCNPCVTISFFPVLNEEEEATQRASDRRENLRSIGINLDLIKE